ncbi:hypothetical protein FQN57_007485 [Myotisia sp. PD_48]|nr:hypothetical protein FQN57_007485 [Myotisia sp. PD_48]
MNYLSKLKDNKEGGSSDKKDPLKTVTDLAGKLKPSDGTKSAPADGTEKKETNEEKAKGFLTKFLKKVLKV